MQGRTLVGVAAAIGNYTGIDPIVFRVLFAVLTIFGGVGVLLYLLGWALIPVAGRPAWYDDLLSRRHGRVQALVLSVAVAALVVLLAGALSLPGVRPRLFVLVLFIAVVALVVGTVHRRPASAMPYESSLGSSEPPMATAAWSPPPAPAPVPPRPRSRITWPAIGAAALIAVGLAALALTGTVSLTLSQVLWCTFGAALLGFAASLVQRPAAYGLLLVMGLLAIAAAMTRVIPDGATWTAGTRSWAPTTVADIQPTYNLGIGKEVIDLTELPASSQATVHAVLGVGDVVVRVPAGSRVIVHGHVAAGGIDAFGRRIGGLAADLSQIYPAPLATTGSVFTIDGHVGYGIIKVVHPFSAALQRHPKPVSPAATSSRHRTASSSRLAHRSHR